MDDEGMAREALYGRQTRSGHCSLTPLRPDEYGRVAGFPESFEWIEWDRIMWPFESKHSVMVGISNDHKSPQVISYRVIYADGVHGGFQSW